MVIVLPLVGVVGGTPTGTPSVAAAEAGRPDLAWAGDRPSSPSPVPPTSAKRPAASPRPPVKRVAPVPPPVRIAASGPGTFRTAAITGRAAGTRGKLLRYSVAVEHGLPFDPKATAAEIHRTLSDRRSWTGSGTWRLELVGAGQRADFRVLLATPGTTDRHCAPLMTRGKLSCQRGNRAILNARRWAFGISFYGRSVAAYRVYLANHEVGHVLGYGHKRCPGRGQPAPVMQQQTKGLQGCRANSWPSPRRR